MVSRVFFLCVKIQVFANRVAYCKYVDHKQIVQMVQWNLYKWIQQRDCYFILYKWALKILHNCLSSFMYFWTIQIISFILKTLKYSVFFLARSAIDAAVFLHLFDVLMFKKDLMLFCCPRFTRFSFLLSLCRIKYVMIIGIHCFVFRMLDITIRCII